MFTRRKSVWMVFLYYLSLFKPSSKNCTTTWVIYYTRTTRDLRLILHVFMFFHSVPHCLHLRLILFTYPTQFRFDFLFRYPRGKFQTKRFVVFEFYNLTPNCRHPFLHQFLQQMAFTIPIHCLGETRKYGRDAHKHFNDGIFFIVSWLTFFIGIVGSSCIFINVQQ